jgi:hypothetical protein
LSLGFYVQSLDTHLGYYKNGIWTWVV